MFRNVWTLILRPPPRSTLLPYTTLFRSQGRVTVTGRVDGMVSSGGMLHAPRSVARLIATAPGVESVRLRVVPDQRMGDRKSTRLNSSHVAISYAVFCLKKKT